MLSLSELELKWNKEKNAYVKKEIGDGVQKFVKEVLKCPEVFNLKEGLNSTPLEKRKNEFKEEETKRAARRADVVIFVNPEIIIPMEIEKYQNLKAGENQIIKYQLDWNEYTNRRYGILTDGYIWRFYNNNEYRTFTLEDIFDKTGEFLEFWNEYTKPEFYYLAFFEKRGQQSLLKESEILHVEKYRRLFFEDITKLIKSFKNKLNLEGYLKNFEKKEREKKSIELTYAYIIQFILYKTLVDNEFNKFGKEFKDIQQTIFDCLKAGQYGKILGVIDGVSRIISQNIYHPFDKEQEFITQKLLDLIRQPKNELHDVSPWLDIFVFIKKYNFANVKNEIFGYIYENYLKALYEDTKKGQYFTDPSVVNFMLDQVDYTERHLRHTLCFDRDVSIIDPSCGCGTFLYSATDRLMQATHYTTEKAAKKLEQLICESVFGLDIEEFPLYLAEMNIIMRMLPMILHNEYSAPISDKIKVFKTNDSMSEFLDTAIKNTLNDMDVAYHKSNGQMSLFTEKLNLGYASYVRDEGDLAEMKKSLENHNIPRRRFDYVVGNPPYVSYNECSKSGLLIFKLIKEGKVKLNDIYGVNLHSIPEHRKKYSPKPNLYAFFIALGIALLKDGAKICYIVPQTLLTAGDLDVLRYHLAKFTTIERIITFSGKMFIGRGLKQNKPVATSSLVFVASRKTPELTNEVEVIHYKDPNDDVEKCLSNILEYNHKKYVYKKIMQNTLLQNVSNWNFIKQDKEFLDFYDEYKKNTDDFSIYYNHATAECNFKSRFYFDIGYDINEKKLLKSPDKTVDCYKYPKFNKNYYTIKEFRGYYTNIRSGNSKLKIDLLRNNQGYNLLDSNFKIIWSYINFDRFYFSIEPLIWARNQICGIGSSNKPELFYLFSILNSVIINRILEATLKNDNEKDYLVSIASVKEFIRVPKITADNQFIKDEIIKRTEEMIALEDVKMADLVDFSAVLMQKFDDVSVEDKDLILIKGNTKIRCKIKKEKNLVELALVTERAGKGQNKLKLIEKEIILSELKEMVVIDFDRQKELKDYIDDLVFALYFNVIISEIGLDKAGKIKKMCEENKFYKIITLS